MNFRSVLAAVLAIAALAGCALQGQLAAVSEESVPGNTLEERQRQTGVAYRQLQQVRYDKRLAEQEYLNAQSAYEAAQKNADAWKARAERARSDYAAAQAREKQAEAAYERGIRSVNDRSK